MIPADRRPGAVHAGVFALYVLLAAIYTHPLLAQADLRIANDPGDPVLNASVLWWNATTLPFSRAWWTPPHFYPVEGISALTENLVGLGVVATPAFWLSGNPLVAYNVTLFATWPLSAMAAYLLTFVLVRRHDAAFVAGLAFGFAPYRVTQLAHIQVLSAYWFPVALVALHRYLDDRRRRWLLIFGAAWILLSLSNGYFMLFGAVLIAGWLAYFCSRSGFRTAAPRILLTWALASLPLALVLWNYRLIHQHYGFVRSVDAAIGYSAQPWAFTQVSNVVWFWGSRLGDTEPEVNLFPGATVVVLTVLGILALAFRKEREVEVESLRRRILRWLLGICAGLAAAGALRLLIAGPWRLALPGLTLRMSDLDRALIVIAACGIPFLWLTPSTRDALQRRSAFVFYTAATLAVVAFCMGPVVRLGHDVLLDPAPYQLLRLLPGFDALRVPTRFWMLGALCLAVAGGLAFARLVPARGRLRVFVTTLVAAGTLLDGWMRFMPLAEPPARWARVEPGGIDAAIIELPLGPSWDAAATFRALWHRRRVVNGVSGYDPPHYATLQLGLNDHDPSMLLALASLGPIDAVVDASQDPDGRIARYVQSLDGVASVRTDGVRTAFRLPAAPPADRRTGTPLDIASAWSSVSGDLHAALDADLSTRWRIEPQRPGQWVQVDLGAVRDVGVVETSLGRAHLEYPRRLSIDVSLDGVTWSEVWEGSTVGEAFLAAAREPLTVPLQFRFEAQPARYIRLRQTSDAGGPWSIAEIRAYGT